MAFTAPTFTADDATGSPDEADSAVSAAEHDESTMEHAGQQDPAPGGGDDGDVDHDSPATGSASGKAGKARKSSGPDRATIRRIATKTVETSTADSTELEVLASLLSVSGTDPIDLTVAVMTSSRSAMNPVTDLLSIADADPMEAGVLTLGMERPRMRAVWNLAAKLDLIKGQIPGADSKAALSLAKAVQQIGQPSRDLLDGVLTLAKRGW
ncbi:hypothetical protein [Isoptericola croceus]|uniref:hypothetical protein n=1 Tax=Isoptericola croceus TaxID=3031406 RepID=UPI0023F76A37|nr:hypothetical protein [Isoptericola croceus]